ncbi:MAG: sugar ABC transporter substrate-binding protein, partial [Propionibacteriaceae bacterium]|nr:sugar ABC transporter substrate-binding protein [Propionibacteriaceae bacterium]
MKYRRATALALCATLALGLGACSGGTSDSKKSEQAQAMYTWVSSESDREQWETFVKGVQETDPDFKLTIDGPSFQDYWTKVKTRMSSSDAPCIITTQAAR